MKRHWFHCSVVDHGPVLTVERRPPAHRAPKEPLTPRLCVASTVARCFAAVFFQRGPVYCYRTSRPVGGIKPVDVWNSHITLERWLIPPMTLSLDRVILPNTVKRATWLMCAYLNDCQIKGIDPWLRVAHYAICFRELGGPKWEENWIKTLQRIYGVFDPEELILKKASEKPERNKA